MKHPLWLTVALAIVVAPMLGCRSSKRVSRRCAKKSCAPMARNMPTPDAVTTPYAPPEMADSGFGEMAPMPPAPPTMPADAYAPPMAEMPAMPADPGYATQPAPVAGSAELAAAQAELDRLRQENALAEQRAREAESALLDMPPAPAPAMPDLSGPGVGGAEMSSLEAQLRSRVNGEVVREGNTVIVRLTDAFESGRDSLKRDSRLMGTLDATADALKSNPGARVSVVGHSDSTPIVKTKHLWRSNHHLSEARAKRVAEKLAQNGVTQQQIVSVVGRGASEPLVPERSRADQARNRRVEIMISL